MKSYEERFDELCEENFIPAHDPLRIAISELIQEADAELTKLREENQRLRYQIECKNGLLNNHQCIPRMAIKQAKIEVLREVQAVLRKWWTIDDVQDELHDKLKQLEGE